MNRIGIAVLAGVALLLAALAFRPTPVPAAAPLRRAVVPPPATAVVAAVSPTAGLLREAEAELIALCEERDRLLERKRRLQPPEPPSRSAVDHYRRAERHYQEGDFVRAIAECEEAIKLDASHPPARALLKEARFHLTNLRARSAAEDLSGAAVRLGVAAVEDALVRGARHDRAGELDAAEREGLKALEYAKSLPPDETARDLERAAQELLDRIRARR